MSQVVPDLPLASSLAKNIAMVEDLFLYKSDIVKRTFTMGGKGGRNGVLFFVEGMVDQPAVARYILEPLLCAKPEELPETPQEIAENILLYPSIQRVHRLNDLSRELLSGNCVVLFEGAAEGLLIDSRKWERRSVNEPATEKVVRGPREGFVETLRVNRVLLRRKLPHPNLVMEDLKVGRLTLTTVTVAYIAGVAREDLIQEVKERIQRIEVDAILDSGQIEQFIEDSPYSPFATVANSEKPDKVAGKLLEGRVAIMVDGSPIVLTVPQLFSESFQSAEDQYSRPYFVSFIRLLRYVAFAISLLGPAFFVAITTFHQRLIPYDLFLTMLAAEDSTPFPAVFSVLLMLIIYELLREAGVRMPTPAGNALNIVGALVIGDAAVSAGLISAPVVIVVALTAICSYVVNPLVDAVSLLRFGFLFLGATLGAFGILAGGILLLLHLITLRSFGTPYFMPFAPVVKRQWRDALLKAPIWALDRRYLDGPASLHRQAPNQKPGPQQDKKSQREQAKEE